MFGEGVEAEFDGVVGGAEVCCSRRFRCISC